MEKEDGLQWDVILLNNKTMVIEADSVWPSDSGALVFFKFTGFNNNQKNGQAKKEKEVVKILAPGSWFSVEPHVEKNQREKQQELEKQQKEKIIQLFRQTNYTYKGLDDLAKRLQTTTKQVSWILCKMIQEKKNVKLEWFIDSNMQSILDSHLPELLRRHYGNNDKISLSNVKDTLSIKQETKDIDYVQLSIWLVKNKYL